MSEMRSEEGNKIAGAPFRPYDSEYRWRLWVYSNQAGQPLKIHVFWWRLFFAALLTSVCAWMVAALIAFLIIREKHEFKEIEYINIVLPSRWPLHRQALGKSYILRANEAYLEKKYGDALRYYVQGVPRVSDDYDARERLAELLIGFGNPAAATNVLTDNLDVNTVKADYLRHVFAVLFEYGREEEILQLTSKELNREDLATDERCQYLAFQAARAYFQRGEYDACERLLEKDGLNGHCPTIVLLAQCDWERGYPELAISRLDQARIKFPLALEIPLQLIRFYRDLGQYDRMYDESLLRLSMEPTGFGGRLDLIYAYQIQGRMTQVDKEIDLYIKDFAEVKEALWALTSFAREFGLVELVYRIINQASEVERMNAGYKILEIQTYISADRYADAKRLAELMLTTYPQDTFIGGLVVGLRAVACYGLGDVTNGEVYLQAYLSVQHLPSGDAFFVFEKLQRVGALRAARSVIANLVRREPYNQNAVTRLVQYDAENGNLASLEVNLPNLLKMSKPSRRVLQAVYLKLDNSTPQRAALRDSVAAAVARLTDTPLPK